MKTATIPSLRVDPALRRAAEGVLEEGESLSSFVEQSVRAHIERRKAQDEFIARGLASRDKAKHAGAYVSSDDVIKALASRLSKAKKKAG
ncbi:MAG: YlcI/YnfO family protein [Lysobacteraceae bacterium]